MQWSRAEKVGHRGSWRNASCFVPSAVVPACRSVPGCTFPVIRVSRYMLGGPGRQRSRPLLQEPGLPATMQPWHPGAPVVVATPARSSRAVRAAPRPVSRRLCWRSRRLHRCRCALGRQGLRIGVALRSRRCKSYWLLCRNAGSLTPCIGSHACQLIHTVLDTPMRARQRFGDVRTS